MDRMDQVLFDIDMEFFFDILFEKMQNRISPEQAERFFPQEIRDRNASENE